MPPIARFAYIRQNPTPSERDRVPVGEHFFHLAWAVQLTIWQGGEIVA